MAPRLIIEVAEKQHKVLKAMAALEGTSMREYVTKRLFPEPNDISVEAMKDARSGDVTEIEDIHDLN